MTALDTAKAVLAKASLSDQTFANPDLGIAMAWAEILGNIDRTDALDAVTAHYTTETRRLMPADVLRYVRKVRADRIRENFSEPNYDRDDVLGGLAAIRAHRRAIADGAERLTDDMEGDARPVKEFLQVAAARLPRVPRVGGNGGAA